MYLKLFPLTSLFIFTLSINAEDINTTTTIIENATKATTQLQTQFSELMEEEKPQQEPLDENKSKVDKEEIQATEVITVEEPPIEKTVTQQEEITPKLKENLSTVIQKESVTVIKEENLSIAPVAEPIEEPTIEVPKEVPVEESIEKETLPTEITEINQTDTSDENISSQVSTIEDEVVETIETNSSETTEKENEEDEGSFTKGMIIFKTKIKANCEMNGDEFAKHYSQEDWDDIYDSNEFKNVVIKICPKMEGKYEDKWTNDLYQFSIKYASDSDEIPEC